MIFFCYNRVRHTCMLQIILDLKITAHFRWVQWITIQMMDTDLLMHIYHIVVFVLYKQLSHDQ